MAGHLRRRGKKSWAYIISVEQEDGSRKRRWFTIKAENEKAARAQARRIETDLETGAFVEPSKLTVSEYLTKWLTNTRPDVSGRTFDHYQEICERHLIPSLGAIPLQKLQPTAIKSYKAEKLETGRLDGKGGLSPKSVQHHLRILHKALGDAMRDELLVRNPCDAVKAPKVARTRVRYLNIEQMNALCESAKRTRLYVPIVLAVTTGMRRGEILALRWDDVDLERGLVTVSRALEQTKARGVKVKEPKSAESRRVIPVPRSVIEVLKAHKREQAEERLAAGAAWENNELVCPNRLGAFWSPNGFSSAFAAHVKGKRLPKVTFHALRHSHAVYLSERFPIKAVSDRLGHSTSRITLDFYTNTSGEMDTAITDAIGSAFASL